MLSFTLDDLISLTSENGDCLGHVIDLTFTSKYYDSDSLKEDFNISYTKLFVAGQSSEEDIDADVANKFIETVENASKSLAPGIRSLFQIL